MTENEIVLVLICAPYYLSSSKSPPSTLHGTTKTIVNSIINNLNTNSSYCYLSHADMPSYQLSGILKRISFVAFCRLHMISAPEFSDVSLQRLFGYLRDYNITNDLDITDQQLKIMWPRFENAVDACKRQGATNDNLKELIRAVIEMGGDKVAWSSRLDMDGNGHLHVYQA